MADAEPVERQEGFGTGATPCEYFYFNGSRIARRDATGNVRYFFSDHLGSIGRIEAFLADGTPSTVERSEYYPYGGEMVLYDGDVNAYKFTGKERDPETTLNPLDNFIARHYSGNFGRFMQPDEPFVDQLEEDPQSWNLYTYVRNNPLAYTDPTGRTCQTNADDGTVYDDGDGKGCDQVDKENAEAEPNVTVTAQAPSILESTVQMTLDDIGWGVNYVLEQTAGAWMGSFLEASSSKDPLVFALAVGSMVSGGKGSGGKGALRLGARKSAQRWANQLKKRGWTMDQIKEAVEQGQRFPAPNKVNPGNTATRYVHPTSGKSVIVR